MTKVRSARRVSSFADSVFGEMTRLAKLHNAVNLSQGFPDFEAPQAIKDAACTAIQAEQNQYAPPYGTHALRDAIAVRLHAPLRRAGRTPTSRSPSAAGPPKR